MSVVNVLWYDGVFLEVRIVEMLFFYMLLVFVELGYFFIFKWGDVIRLSDFV